MTITLTPAQAAWIQAHVATGDFSSIEEAARRLIDERIAERVAEAGTLASRDHRQVLLAGELSDADLEAIAGTEMAAHHRHLDQELN